MLLELHRIKGGVGGDRHTNTIEGRGYLNEYA